MRVNDNYIGSVVENRAMNTTTTQNKNYNSVICRVNEFPLNMNKKQVVEKPNPSTTQVINEGDGRLFSISKMKKEINSMLKSKNSISRSQFKPTLQEEACLIKKKINEDLQSRIKINQKQNEPRLNKVMKHLIK